MSAPVERAAGDCTSMDVDDIIYTSNKAVPANANDYPNLVGIKA